MRYTIETNDAIWSNLDGWERVKAFFAEVAPQAVMYDESGHEVTSRLEAIAALMSGRILVWANREESENDDGSKAIASIRAQ